MSANISDHLFCLSLIITECMGDHTVNKFTDFFIQRLQTFFLIFVTFLYF